MTTLFISDLHLDDARPQSTELFERFIREEAMQADALFVLGDLFEYWAGDDMPSKTSARVAAALSSLAESGVPAYFMHGNRDFLVGEEFAAQSRLELLPEAHLIDLHGTQTLLLHGDTLCIDDTVYQEIRLKVRSDQWQTWFLSQSPAEREAFALGARKESRAHQSNLSMDIMDVNQGFVCRTFERYGVSQMIHGHTHRQAVHDHQTSDGSAQRFVLGDWYDKGSVLRASTDGLKLESYPG